MRVLSKGPDRLFNPKNLRPVQGLESAFLLPQRSLKGNLRHSGEGRDWLKKCGLLVSRQSLIWKQCNKHSI